MIALDFDFNFCLNAALLQEELRYTNTLRVANFNNSGSNRCAHFWIT